MAIYNKYEEFENLMEKYNFDAPIKVTLVLEEEDVLDPFLSKGLNSTEISKTTDLNADNAKNKTFPAKKNHNVESIEDENNQSIPVKPLPKVLPEQTEDITSKLLDAVADNLIHIAKCYYHNFIQTRNEMENEKLKSEYLIFKHHFFRLSYSTTIAILLPNENNKPFIHNFIYRVIKIANRSRCQISFDIIETLVRDMLIWSRKKKIYLCTKFGSHYHKSEDLDYFRNARTISSRFNHSKTIESRTFDNGSTINYTTQIRSSQPDNVPRTNPPNQALNIGPNYWDRSNYSPQELYIPLNNTSRIFRQDITHPNSSYHINNNSPYDKILQPQHQLNNILHVIQRTNQSNQELSATCDIKQKATNTMQGINRLPYMDSKTCPTEATNLFHNNEPKTNYFNNGKERNGNMTKIFSSVGATNQEISISVDSEILANINPQNKTLFNNDPAQTHVNKSVKRRKPSYSNYQHCDANNTQDYNKSKSHYQKNNCSTTFSSRSDPLCQSDNCFNTDPMRSSISRDSGFCSPLYGSIRNEEMIEMQSNEENESPIISHVTSMNPNAVILQKSSCTVCGAATNNMCIGCYQKYYCSLPCQKKDWYIHKYLCTVEV